MPIDTQTPDSPGWWLARLEKRLVDRRPRLDRLWRYYIGEPDLPEGADGCREAYRAFQRKARTNYARLAVKATRDRIVLTGFRTGADDDENGDRAARSIIYANGLRVEYGDLHTFALVMGVGYTITGGPTSATAGLPTITVEDPRQVITDHDPVNVRRVRAALKIFTDDADEGGTDYAYLYLPGQVFVATRPTRRVRTVAGGSWEWDQDRSGPLPNGFEDVVPVVRFLNEDGLGEFEPHLDLLDRINKTVLDRMVIAAMQAFRQRGIAGDLPDVDEDGNEIDYAALFRPGPGELWKMPEGAVLTELGATDLRPILEAAKDDVRDFAAVTATPLYFISPDAANGSAEGASTMREAHVFKCEDRIVRFSDSHAQTMAHAFRFAGDDVRANLLAMEPLFRPAERHSLVERSQASSQAQDVPWRTRMTDIWQFSPDKVAEMETERSMDALLAGLGPEAPVTDANTA